MVRCNDPRLASGAARLRCRGWLTTAVIVAGLLAGCGTSNSSSTSDSDGPRTTTSRPPTTNTTTAQPDELVIEDPDGYRYALQLMSVEVGPTVVPRGGLADEPPGYTAISVTLGFRNLLSDRSSIDLNMFGGSQRVKLGIRSERFGAGGCPPGWEKGRPPPSTRTLVAVSDYCILLGYDGYTGLASSAGPGGNTTLVVYEGGVPESIGVQQDDAAIFFFDPQFLFAPEYSGEFDQSSRPDLFVRIP